MNFLARKAQKTFCDTVRLKVQGGAGGPGLPKYGGVGGKGGDVYIVGSRFVDKLKSVITHKACKNGWYQAGNGQAALRTRLLGKAGQDMMIRVPLGVTVSDLDNQVIMGEINQPRDKIIVALGGRGGDKFNDGHGFVGQKRTLKLDFQMISDAVFVGFPNAGKSSLLRQVSDAKPLVADYPFTTLRPYLGVVKYHDYRRITMADLPGLVEGAHQNIGIGHEFLKHITRTRVLIFVIDVNKVDLGPNYAMRSPLEVLCILNKEIELYDDTILRKPAILVVNKVDSFNSDSTEMRRFGQFREEYEKLHSSYENLSALRDHMRPENLIEFKDIIPISAEKRLGIEELKRATRRVIDEEEESAKFERDKFSKFSDIQAMENNRIVQ